MIPYPWTVGRARNDGCSGFSTTLDFVAHTCNSRTYKDESRSQTESYNRTLSQKIPKQTINK